MVVILKREQIIGEFGSVENFDEVCKNFAQIVEDHKNTEDIAAPTAHHVVEAIVRRHNGEYKFDDAVIIEHEVKRTLDQRKTIILAELAAFRWSFQNASRVAVGSVVVPTDPGTLNQFIAALIMKTPVDWKVTERDFVTFDLREIKNAIRAIRAHVQLAFDIERKMIARIVACRSHKALDEINIAEAFNVAA